jgi:hypothetical protein
MIGEPAERGEATIDEAAVILDISTTTVRRLIASGVLPPKQPCTEVTRRANRYVMRPISLTTSAA